MNASIIAIEYDKVKTILSVHAHINERNNQNEMCVQFELIKSDLITVFKASFCFQLDRLGPS